MTIFTSSIGEGLVILTVLAVLLSFFRKHLPVVLIVIAALLALFVFFPNALFQFVVLVGYLRSHLH